MKIFDNIHIPETLCAQNYANHDIVRFLESIGAEFGACQNARTSFDDTVYELVVPASDLPKGLSVFAEFASKIRCLVVTCCSELLPSIA